MPAWGQDQVVVFPERPLPAMPVEMTERRVAELPPLPAELGPRIDLSAELVERLEKDRAKLPSKYDVTRIGQRGIGGGMNFYSLERERRMGQELAQQIEGQARVLTDPVVTEYVNRIGQNIVRNSDARVPFIIKVLDSEEVNAFALPGGFFYVNSGLILAADNEAELAGVMAHEIAHVAARHATKNATKAELFNLASIPLIFLGGPAGLAARQAAGFLIPMSFLKFSRNAEREADLLGMEYLYAAGYDPASFIDFFEKLDAKRKEKRSFLAKAFSTHPMNEDRIKNAHKTMERYLPERETYVVTTSEFDQVRARLVSLTMKRMIDVGKGPRPTLRKRTGGAPELPESKEPAETSQDPDRPTLRRRPD